MYALISFLYIYIYLLCRFLAFVAVLPACCADAARMETTPQSLGWSMPSLCCWVWASPASCSCQAWKSIWRRWPSNPECFLAIQVFGYLFYRAAADVFWPFLCCFLRHCRFQAFVKEEWGRPSRESKVMWTAMCWWAIRLCIVCALGWPCSSFSSLSSW